MEGIRAVGTVQTVKIKREIQEGKDNNKGKDDNIRYNPKEYINSNLINLKLYYNN